MRVLVAGAGAIGQWLGARLTQAGHQVVAWTSARHVPALGDLEVTGHTSWRGALHAVATPAEAAQATPGGYEAIALTGKAYLTRELAAGCAGLLAPGGVAVTLQNGFGNGDKVAQAFGRAPVAVAVTSHGVMVKRPGRLVHAGTGPTRVGPIDASAIPAARLALRLLADAGLEPGWADDMGPHVWLKGLVNHAINPVAAVAGVPNGALRDGPLAARAAGLADEGWALSRAAGVPLPEVASGAHLQSLVAATVACTAANRCSMLQDVAARRPTEVEQISGHLVRLARRLGHPAVASEQAYRDVKAIEASYLGEQASLELTRAEVSA